MRVKREPCRPHNQSLYQTATSMDPPQPPTKRKRTDLLQNESFESAVEAEPWFEDGNVILWAGNSRFKVHRGVLSSRSPILKDMFASDNMDESIDSCPIVHLSDQVEDVTHVMRAIYDRR